MHRNGWANRDLKFENAVGFRNVLNPHFVRQTSEQLLMVLEEMVNVMLMPTLWVVLPLQCLQRWPKDLIMSFFTIPIHWELFCMSYHIIDNFLIRPTLTSIGILRTGGLWLITRKSMTYKVLTISRELKQLILSLLQPNPQNRRSVQQIKASKWSTIKKH